MTDATEVTQAIVARPVVMGYAVAIGLSMAAAEQVWHRDIAPRLPMKSALQVMHAGREAMEKEAAALSPDQTAARLKRLMEREASDSRDLSVPKD